MKDSFLKKDIELVSFLAQRLMHPSIEMPTVIYSPDSYFLAVLSEGGSSFHIVTFAILFYE